MLSYGPEIVEDFAMCYDGKNIGPSLLFLSDGEVDYLHEEHRPRHSNSYVALFSLWQVTLRVLHHILSTFGSSFPSSIFASTPVGDPPTRPARKGLATSWKIVLRGSCLFFAKFYV